MTTQDSITINRSDLDNDRSSASLSSIAQSDDTTPSALTVGTKHTDDFDSSGNRHYTNAGHGYGVHRKWLAELTLGFVAGPDKTLMKDFRFKGPLRVQRPFYPEGEPCHVYILHPPGGLVSGDNLKIDINCYKNSHAVLTTPSAGKIYQADSCNVEQHQIINLRVDDAVCEWLPQETIVFNGANGYLNTELELSEGAKFIGWDIYCLGRTAGNKPFNQGRVVQTLKVTKAGTPLLIERQVVHGGSDELAHRYGFSGHSVSGTLVAFGLANLPQSVVLLRKSIARVSDEMNVKGVLAVTQRLDLLIVRYLGPCSEEGKNLFIHCWKLLRQELLELDASEPRIWLT